jgi:putative lipoprotein
MRRSRAAHVLAASVLAALLMVPAMSHAQTEPPKAEAPPAAVTGSALYLARIAAPPEAVFEAVLAEVSRADAPAVTLGRVVLRDAGNPPYAFSIPYDRDAVPPQAVLAVRATLAAGGRFLFTSDTVNRVEPGAGAVGEIVMVPVNAPLALVGPTWVLEAMGDGAVVAPDPAMREQPNLTFAEDGRATGSGGCNRVNMGFAAGAAGALFMGPGAMTMMACPPPAGEIEQALMQALEAADAWAVADGRLTLSAAGAEVAVFRAAP